MTLPTVETFAAPPDAARPGVILVIDASRAMAGKIDGVSRMVAVGSALASNFVDFESRFNVGIVAYGNSTGKNCRATKVVKPLSVLQAAEHGTQIAILQPRGAAPLSRALQVGANYAVKFDPTPAILLVATTSGNCQGDPCATAFALKRQIPALRIHAVALAPSSSGEIDRIRCIAGRTGGTFRVSSGEAQLTASIRGLLNSVAGDFVAARQAAGGWQTARTEPADSARTGGSLSGGSDEVTANRTGAGDAGRTGAEPAGTEVGLSALLTENGQAIRSGLVWHVYSAKRSPDGGYKRVRTIRGNADRIMLAPGTYLVSATYGRAFLTKRITVRPNTPIQEDFVLNAGGLRAHAIWPDGRHLTDKSVTYDIYSDEKDQFGNRRKVLAGAHAGIIVRLNAGIYHIVSTYGDANATVGSDVTVLAGKLTDVTINHGAARVTFKLVRQPGGEALADTRWQILGPNGSVIKESVGAIPTHVLAAGNYTVFAHRGGRKFGQKFSLTPGAIRQVEVMVR